jgi:hypothetical protein
VRSSSGEREGKRSYTVEVVENLLPRMDAKTPAEVSQFLHLPLPKHLEGRESTFSADALQSDSGDHKLMPFLREVVDQLIWVLVNDGRAADLVKAYAMHEWINRGVPVLQQGFQHVVAQAALATADPSAFRTCLALLYGNFSREKVMGLMEEARDGMQQNVSFFPGTSTSSHTRGVADFHAMMAGESIPAVLRATLERVLADWVPGHLTDQVEQYSKTLEDQQRAFRGGGEEGYHVASGWARTSEAKAPKISLPDVVTATLKARAGPLKASVTAQEGYSLALGALGDSSVAWHTPAVVTFSRVKTSTFKAKEGPRRS